MKSFITLLFLVSEMQLVCQTLVRGPYLQKPTSTSIIIRWRTVQTTDSRVYYGNSPSNLTIYKDDTASSTEHRVELTALTPFTKYFYSAGSTTQTQSGPDSSHFFVTSPVIGTVQPVRIWAIGDFGKANDKQKKVRDSYIGYTGNTHTDVWLWLGDNAYSDGTDAQYQSNVFDSIYGYHKLFRYMPFMPTPGNHDYLSVCSPTCATTPPNHTGPYYDIVDVPKNGEAGGVASGYELFYSYDYGNIHFISLNSELSSNVPFGYNWTGANTFASFSSSPLTQWLESDLQANTKTWTIAYWHQPPYTDGSHDASAFWEVYMKAMRENFVPILEKYGVDLVVCGHSHVYERTYLLKGHYGNPSTFNKATMVVDSSSGNYAQGEPYIKDPAAPKEKNGAVYVVTGNSGSSDPNPPLNYPAMRFDEGCDTCVGSLVIDVLGNRLDARYLRADGSIGDDFTLLKQIPSSGGKNDSLVKEFKVYPNPFTGHTNIEFQLMQPSVVDINVYDANGKLVHIIAGNKQSSGSQLYVFDANGAALGKGIYWIKIAAGGIICAEKIIKVE